MGYDDRQCDVLVTYMQRNMAPTQIHETLLLECLEQREADAFSLENDKIPRLFDRSYSYLD